MSYIYHYHATNSENNKVNHLDGIVSRVDPILTFEDYKKLKAALEQQFLLDNLTIRSLTLLHTVEA